MIELRLTGITAEEVRAISRTLHQFRDEIPTFNHGGTIAQHWAPIVTAEGPTAFTVVTPKVSPMVARAVVGSLCADRLPLNGLVMAPALA